MCGNMASKQLFLLFFSIFFILHDVIDAQIHDFQQNPGQSLMRRDETGLKPFNNVPKKMAKLKGIFGDLFNGNDPEEYSSDKENVFFVNKFNEKLKKLTKQDENKEPLWERILDSYKAKINNGGIKKESFPRKNFYNKNSNQSEKNKKFFKNTDSVRTEQDGEQQYPSSTQELSRKSITTLLDDLKKNNLYKSPEDIKYEKINQDNSHYRMNSRQIDLPLLIKKPAAEESVTPMQTMLPASSDGMVKSHFATKKRSTDTVVQKTMVTTKKKSPVVEHFNSAVDELFIIYNRVFNSGNFLLQGPVKTSNYYTLTEGQTDVLNDLRFMETLNIKIAPGKSTSEEPENENIMVLMGYDNILRIEDTKGEKKNNQYVITIPIKLGPIKVSPKNNMNQITKMKFSQTGELTIVAEESEEKPAFFVQSLHLFKLDPDEVFFDSSFNGETQHMLSEEMEEFIVKLKLVEFLNSLFEKLLATDDVINMFTGE